MKIRNNIILVTILCLAAFALGACNYWEAADQSSINISFGGSNALSVLDKDKSEMVYTITLTSPGKDTITRTAEKGETHISIPVSEGKWSIHLRGEGDRRIGEGRADVAVAAGKPASVFINMDVTGTKVRDYKELVDDFNDGSLPENFFIEIIGDELIAYSSSDHDSPNVAILSNGKTITLRAKTKSGSLLIKRDIKTNKIDSNVFRIKNGTLILDGKPDDTITVNGRKNELGSIKCTRALINVETASSKLIMHNNVTLTNNITANGGGVHVSSGGTFFMYGGTITNNEVENEGGGVYISGEFSKTGGTISSNKAGKRGQNVMLNDNPIDSDY